MALHGVVDCFAREVGGRIGFALLGAFLTGRRTLTKEGNNVLTARPAEKLNVLDFRGLHLLKAVCHAAAEPILSGRKVICPNTVVVAFGEPCERVRVQVPQERNSVLNMIVGEYERFCCFTGLKNFGDREAVFLRGVLQEFCATYTEAFFLVARIDQVLATSLIDRLLKVLIVVLEIFNRADMSTVADNVFKNIQTLVCLRPFRVLEQIVQYVVKMQRPLHGDVF